MTMTKDEAKQISNRYRILILIAGGTLAIGTVAMHFIEGWRYLDAFYFSVISLTTVGYGDLTPKTDGGKLFVIGYLIVGISIMAALINNVLRGALTSRAIHRDAKGKPQRIFQSPRGPSRPSRSTDA